MPTSTFVSSPSYLPNSAKPIVSPTQPLVRAPSRSPFTYPFILASRRPPTACITNEHPPDNPQPTSQSDDDPPLLPDFDRDYYDELKALYADDPQVTIFSKDDYTIDPSLTPWLYEHRGRDLATLSATAAAAERENPSPPYDPSDLDSFAHRPMRQSDMHSAEELDNFETAARTYDPVSGGPWTDPMPESDFTASPDSETIHFRDVTPSSIEAAQRDNDIPIDPPQGFPSPLPRVQYASEEEEIAALNRSLDAMQQYEADLPLETTQFDTMDGPDASDFAHWQKEAKRRGGNSAVGASHALPPFAPVAPEETQKDVDDASLDPPLQHDALVQTHHGLWRGDVHVHALLDEKRAFAPRPMGKFAVSSEARLEHRSGDEVLVWETMVYRDGDELLSDVTFSSSVGKNALEPGRAVSTDGSYVIRPKARALAGVSPSISTSVIRRVVDVPSDAYAVLEMCVVCGVGRARRRHRMFLLSDSPSTQKRKKITPRFAFLIVVSERPVDGRGGSYVQTTPLTASAFAGVWAGRALSLHPEFPPDGVRHVETHCKVRTADRIVEEDVSWVDLESGDAPSSFSSPIFDPEVDLQVDSDLDRKVLEHLAEIGLEPEPPRERRRARPSGGRGGKVSRRVAEARAHDQRRLAACSLLWEEKVGTDEDKGARPQVEKMAWQLLPSEEEVQWLHSPRLGSFVDDYCGLVVNADVLLMWPFDRACPKIWSTVSLVELGQKTVRRRIVAGRNGQNVLVGVLFVTETHLDPEAADNVANYV